MNLASNRIKLREFNPGDTPSVHAYASDEQVTRYLIWGPNRWHDSTQFVSRAIATAAATPRVNYELAIVENASGLVIGGARLRLMASDPKNAQLGYVLARTYWGRGLGFEAATLLVQLSAQLHLHSVSATCDPNNIASQRILEKLDMQYVGYLTCDVYVRGQWRDSLLFTRKSPSLA